jgi:hypothetical protein
LAPPASSSAATSAARRPPPSRVALKIARAFSVTLDALVADSKLPDILGDQAMLDRWQALDALPQGERQRILDVLIRAAQARIAYAKPG